MNSMSLRLSEEAVSPSYSISAEAMEALQRGDTQALIRSHQDRFGGWKMEGEDDDDDEDDNDDDDDTEDGDDDDDDDDSDDDDDDADEDGPEGKKSKKAAKDSIEGLKKKNAALEDEKNRLYRGRAKARKERDDALQKVADLEKAAPGDDDLKKKVTDLEADNSKKDDLLMGARLQIAFLSDNTYEWANPGQALKLADLSEVEVDDDGKVHGLVSALEALAESSPHLLKPKGKRTPANPPTPGSTGRKPASKTTKSKQAERQRVASKYNIHR